MTILKIKSLKFGIQDVIVDDEFYNKYTTTNWSTRYIVNKYSKIQKPYFVCMIKGQYIYLHRLVLNNPIGLEVDHINHDTLDNRACNLRACTHQQNHYNRPPNSNGASKYKGVTWSKQAKKWMAQIKTNKINYSLGLYLDEKQAALAYNQRAEKLFGEYAYQNQI